MLECVIPKHSLIHKQHQTVVFMNIVHNQRINFNNYFILLKDYLDKYIKFKYRLIHTQFQTSIVII